EIAIDNINDPNDTRIIGTRYSSITSGRGSLPIKLSTLNPNFAAMMVEFYNEAGLAYGDHIAIGATGSFPALNIASCAAAEVMGLKVSFINSITSSSWGANDPNYSFVDMHSSLVEAGLLSDPIIAASIGASQDIGRTLSGEGRSDAIEAMRRNGIQFIDGQSVADNINQRLDLLSAREQSLTRDISLYVNIGGGVASFGSDKNESTLPSGLISEPKLDLFRDKQGMLFEMASRGIPLINLRNIQVLMDRFGFPLDPVPLPLPGEGTLYYDLQYDLRYVFGATAILVLLIFGIIVFDRNQNALGKTILKTENS
ncbi:MAG: poly-gamma-glutamate system protein, partial [Bacteroidota bacterium]